MKTKTIAGHKLLSYKSQNYIMTVNNKDYEIYASEFVNKNCWKVKQDSQKSFSTLTAAIYHIERLANV